MNTVAVTINLPMAGSTREDYLHCVSTALMAAQGQGDTVSAMALAGLMQLVSEALSHSAHRSPSLIFDPNSASGYRVAP